MSARSIRAMLTRRLLLVLIATAIATNAVLYFYLRGELIEQYDNALDTEARAMAVAWQEDDDEKPAEIARTFRRLRFGHDGGDVLQIVRRDGSSVLAVPTEGANAMLMRAVVTPPATGRRRYANLTLPNGRRGRSVEIGIDRHAADDVVNPPPPSDPAAFGLVLAEDRREMDDTLTTMAIGLFSIGGALSAAAIALVVTIVGRGLRPLQGFSESVGRLDAASLAFRFPVDELPDELRPISARLNDLLARLDEAFGRERRFSDNVAHELRTPLAELRSMVEVAMKWPPEPEAFAPHHAALLDVVKRMTAVVQNLLMLVRSDPSRLVASVVPLDLVACARAAWTSHERIASARGVSIRFGGSPALNVRADAAILASMLDNLLDNAATYATPASTIECSISEGDLGTRLTLTNRVTDLACDDLVRLEEPFWRKDAARSSGEHSGLGLSLVREYARAMNVGVRYAMPDVEHFTVTLAWPPTAWADQSSPRADSAVRSAGTG